MNGHHLWLCNKQLLFTVCLSLCNLGSPSYAVFNIHMPSCVLGVCSKETLSP